MLYQSAATMTRIDRLCSQLMKPLFLVVSHPPILPECSLLIPRRIHRQD
jgi:hypothetical protein